MLYQGSLQKMHTNLDGLTHSVLNYSAAFPHGPLLAKYSLPLGDQIIELNSCLGRHLRIEYQDIINCVHCGKKTSKSFAQGYCYPCFTRLAECDMCIIKPEKCHYEQGTCRDNDWAHAHCMQPHVVYLANSSGLKVGITRLSNVPSRWVDQGAIAALPIIKVHNRYQSGMMEVTLAEEINDKTNWRKMLKNEVVDIDLLAQKQEILQQMQDKLAAVAASFKFSGVEYLDSPQLYQIKYPVLQYPKKVTSLSLEKQNVVEGVLLGIKGQYLIFDCGVFNVRKFSGYKVKVIVSAKVQDK